MTDLTDMRREPATIALSVLLACAVPAMAAPAASGSAAKTPAAKAALEIPRLTEAPRIDGVLDHPVWESEALRIDDFVQLAPKENGEPTERTVAYLGHDEKNLYIAFRAHDSQSARVRASVTNRDGCLEDDWVFVMLDTFEEKRRAFSFLINPIGIQMDMMRVEEGGNKPTFGLSPAASLSLYETAFSSIGIGVTHARIQANSVTCGTSDCR